MTNFNAHYYVSRHGNLWAYALKLADKLHPEEDRINMAVHIMNDILSAAVKDGTTAPNVTNEIKVLL